MTTDIIQLHNYVVLIEQSQAEKPFVQRCAIDTDVIGFAFYGSGHVELEIKHNGQTKCLTNTTGMALSFFGNQKVEFAHTITPEKPLQSISVFTKIKYLKSLPQAEKEMFSTQLPHLWEPAEHFVQGPSFYMSWDMQQAVQKVFNTTYTGNTRLLFLQSQVNELLAHFFALLGNERKSGISEAEKEKLFQAKEIMTTQISQPPTLTELSKLTGLNSSKLKRHFKELFGVPVFKFLQEERLRKAYSLLSESDMSVQETAWYVGYESLASFSNAFVKRFGARPQEVRQRTFSNKS